MLQAVARKSGTKYHRRCPGKGAYLFPFTPPQLCNPDPAQGRRKDYDRGETLVTVGFLSVGVSIVASSIIILWGLRAAQQRDSQNRTDVGSRIQLRQRRLFAVMTATCVTLSRPDQHAFIADRMI
jgi:hypothetical protein